jgi:hypothetical protein
MQYPYFCIDNFLEDPEEIVRYSKTLNYFKSDIGNWPGERAEITNTKIGYFLSNKIFFAIHPYKTKNFRANSNCHFQKIDDKQGDTGWVHKDPGELTAIIYLSKHKGCGTSIYKPKSFESTPTYESRVIKGQGYKFSKFDQKYNKFLKKHNAQFEETIYFESIYNRLIVFNACAYHGVKNFKINNDPRLTFITFINWMSDDNLKTGVTQSKKIITAE